MLSKLSYISSNTFHCDLGPVLTYTAKKSWNHTDAVLFFLLCDSSDLNNSNEEMIISESVADELPIDSCT